MCLVSSAETLPAGIHQLDAQQVWNWNLEEEWRQLLDALSAAGAGAIVALSVTLPGLLRAQLHVDRASGYRVLCESTALLRPVQVSFAITGDSGVACGAWDFNLCFNPLRCHHTQETLASLWVAGVDLSEHVAQGIAAATFRNKLRASPLVTQHEGSPSWVTFSESHALGHFVRLLMGENLPDSIAEFEAALAHWCPKRQELQARLSWPERCCAGSYTALKLLQAYLDRRQNASVWLRETAMGVPSMGALSSRMADGRRRGSRDAPAADEIEPAAAPSRSWASAARQAMALPMAGMVGAIHAPEVHVACQS